MASNIRIEGLSQAIKKLNKLERAFGSDGLNTKRELLSIAETVKSNIQAEAPVGPTGNLKRSVVAKTFQRQIKNKPAAFTAVHYRTAPHAHLVEYGHVTASGSHTAANPFFRRGVERSRAYVMMRIKKMIQKRIERAAKR